MAIGIFDDVGPLVNYAKDICATCPVKAGCLEAGLGEAWGIWGGFTQPERAAIVAGMPIRPCPGCERLFARKQVRLCAVCKPPAIGSTLSPLADYGPQIAELAAKGYRDDDIAEHFRNELRNASITPDTVRYIRNRDSVPGRARKGRPRSMVRMIEENVQNALTKESVSGLSFPEQAEVLRRWIRRGGTRTTFSKRFGVSGTRVKLLRTYLEETSAESAETT